MPRDNDYAGALEEQAGEAQNGQSHAQKVFRQPERKRQPSYSPQKDADVQKLQIKVDSLIQERAELSEALTGAIAPRGDGILEYGTTRIYLERGIGLHWPEDISHELFQDFGFALFALHDDVQLWVGEYAIEAQRRFSISYDKLALQFGYQPETIRGYVWVCNSVPKSARATNLNFSHYRMVASRKYNTDRIELLQKAAHDNMTVSQFWDYLHIDVDTDPPTPFDAYLSHWSREKKILREFLGGVGDKREQRLIIQSQREYLDQLEKEFGL